MNEAKQQDEKQKLQSMKRAEEPLKKPEAHKSPREEEDQQEFEREKKMTR